MPFPLPEEELDMEAIDAEGLKEIEDYALDGMSRGMASRHGKSLPGDEEANAMETPGVMPEEGAVEGEGGDDVEAMLAALSPEEKAALLATLQG